jgi:hypothetical protein
MWYNQKLHKFLQQPLSMFKLSSEKTIHKGLTKLPKSSHSTCHAILHVDFNMHCVCACARVCVCVCVCGGGGEANCSMKSHRASVQRTPNQQGMIYRVSNDPHILNRITVGDEPWCYLYNPQSKDHTSYLRSPSPCRKQPLHGNHLKGKVTLKMYSDRRHCLRVHSRKA